MENILIPHSSSQTSNNRSNYSSGKSAIRLHNPTNPVQDQQALENGKRTMLSEFFQTNVEYLEARTVLFCNFPESLVYNAAWHCWTPQKRQQNPLDSIGCLRTIHPSNEELFCIWQLLVQRTGCRSWNAIKTVHDVLHPTYKAACTALDLMVNDAMWIETMTEACGSYSSYACHVLFIFILLECSPAEPSMIYDQFSDHRNQIFTSNG